MSPNGRSGGTRLLLLPSKSIRKINGKQKLELVTTFHEVTAPDISRPVIHIPGIIMAQALRQKNCG
jgi:hypothetical protein